MTKYLLIFSIWFIGSCTPKNYDKSSSPNKKNWRCAIDISDKINGVNLVAMPYQTKSSDINSLDTLGANWIALTPFGFIRSNESTVQYNVSGQWYGETFQGIINDVQIAREHNLKIMLKPHLWTHDGWVGDLQFSTNQDWKNFEKTYANYILDFAKIADSLQIESFCIGVELKQITLQKPDILERLIDSVKKVYKGDLTYAANWDNYQNIAFWSKLDYIGIDAYFPLSTFKNPSFNDLTNSWKPITKELQAFSKEINKPILFTEFGYRNIDYTTKEPWTTKQIEGNNEHAQSVAIEAIICNLWNKEWFKGGLLWKWYPNHNKAGGKKNNQFTPQNKSAEKVLQHYYSHK